MAGTEVQILESELAGRRAAFAEALAAELSARLGQELKFTAEPLRTLGVLELADSDDAFLHQPLRFAAAEGAAHVLLPKREAAFLAALEQGVSGEALAGALQADLDAGASAALAQVMESVVDVLQRSFDGAGLPALTLDASRLVNSPQSDPTWIDDSVYVRLRLGLTCAALETGRLDVVFRQSDLAGGGARAQSICFVGMDDAGRKRISELEASLGASAVALEPSELAKPLDDRVLGARVIVIPWELSGRSGLEITESLAREPRLAHVAILVGAPRPTRAQVVAALRAGARAVIPDIYDADAIRSAAASREEAAQ